MKKRGQTIFFLSALVLLLGLGCKGTQSTATQALVRPVTIDYWTVYDNVDMLRQFAKEYKAIRPYVTINVRQVQYQEFNNLFVGALADDVAPDIVSIQPQWLREQQQRLSPMPSVVNVATVSVKDGLQKEVTVTPVQAAMPTVSQVRRNYLSAVGNDVIIDDIAYGLPLAFDNLAVYYNPALLDAAGIALPPTNWVEFVDAVKKTTKFDADGNLVQSGVAMGTGTNVDNAFDVASVLMMQNSVPMETNGIVQFANDLKQVGLAHPTIKALSFYRDFADPTRDTYTWNNEQAPAIDAFARGKVAFYIGNAFDAERIRARGPQVKFDVLPLYQLNQDNPVNAANYWIEAVVKKSPDKDIAWDFIRYMSAAENIDRYVKATNQPSPLRSQLAQQVADSSSIVSHFAAQSLVSKTWYKGNNYQAAITAFKTMLDSLTDPVAENKSPLDRDIEAITRAAQVVQQTY